LGAKHNYATDSHSKQVTCRVTVPIRRVGKPCVLGGRGWTYHKVHGRPYIYDAEANTDSMSVGVTSHEKEADCLHVAEVDRDPLVRQMLVLSDVEFVNVEVTPKNREDLQPSLSDMF